MLTKEELTKRYQVIERARDGIGRMVGVRRLKLSEQLRIVEMAPNSPGDTVMVAAAFCELDGAPIPLPRDRQELDHQLDLLDIEGLTAATECWKRLYGAKPAKGEAASGDGDEPESEVDRAKKSQGTL